jgi:hypothetical protein
LSIGLGAFETAGRPGHRPEGGQHPYPADTGAVGQGKPVLGSDRRREGGRQRGCNFDAADECRSALPALDDACVESAFAAKLGNHQKIEDRLIGRFERTLPQFSDGGQAGQIRRSLETKIGSLHALISRQRLAISMYDDASTF